MKSILVIGMGRFGHHLARKLKELKNEVMIVDADEATINRLASQFQNAQIGDCTNEAVLHSIGVSNFDLCFVTIGNNFQASLEITSLLKELGAKHVISKANRDIQAKFLLKNGADEVVYLERDMAERMAVRYSMSHIMDYFELSGEYGVFEIAVPPAWVGHSIAELGVRARYNMNIMAIKEGGKIRPMPRPEDRFVQGSCVMVMCKGSEMEKFSQNLRK